MLDKFLKGASIWPLEEAQEVSVFLCHLDPMEHPFDISYECNRTLAKVKQYTKQFICQIRALKQFYSKRFHHMLLQSQTPHILLFAWVIDCDVAHTTPCQSQVAAYSEI